MSNSLIEQLSREVPLVVVNRQIAGLPAVVMDVAQGARLAIEHLAGLGHRRIGLLAGPRGSWTSREIRRAGGAGRPRRRRRADRHRAQPAHRARRRGRRRAGAAQRASAPCSPTTT
jgi:DNA-binding LacI/PurR family transcriptional regulator